jgi:hypothetical protein
MIIMTSNFLVFQFDLIADPIGAFGPLSGKFSLTALTRSCHFFSLTADHTTGSDDREVGDGVS